MTDFEEAGRADDLSEAYRASRVRGRLQVGRQRLDAARQALEKVPTRRGRRQAEPDARAALAAFAGALYWAEGSAEEVHVHAALDEAGAFVRSTFGCRFDSRSGVYHQRCPVALAHAGVGFSVGGSARRFCSLCGEDLAECTHRRETAYLVPGGHEDLGWCRVCLKDSTCEHSANERYRARVIGIIREMRVDEISFVTNPAHPDARIVDLPITEKEMASRLGAEYQAGMTVSCDRCLLPCSGPGRANELPN